LRQLKDFGQLAHAHFLRLDEQQQSCPDRVGKEVELGKKRGACHVSEYTNVWMEFKGARMVAVGNATGRLL
jgi:hypothetical protein